LKGHIKQKNETTDGHGCDFGRCGNAAEPRLQRQHRKATRKLDPKRKKRGGRVTRTDILVTAKRSEVKCAVHCLLTTPYTTRRLREKKAEVIRVT